MKLRKLGYLISNGLKNIWANKLMSLASVGILVACMSIIGGSVIITENIDKAFSAVEKENVIMAYLNDYNSVLWGAEVIEPDEITDDMYKVHNKEEALVIAEQIKTIDNVLDVQYVSSEEGIESVKDTLLDGQDEYFDFLEGEGNPISDALKITLKDLSKFEQTLEQISQVDGIDTLQSQSEMASKVAKIKNGITVGSFWLIIVLMIISLVIVSNTIRVTMYNRKLEISIMKAVGATDSFVRLPFLVEGAVIGLISALFSVAVIYFLYKAIIEMLAMSGLIPYAEFVLPLLGLFSLIGVLAGVLGSAVMIRKYLRKEGSEFRAL